MMVREKALLWVLLLALVPYLPSVGDQFVFDDAKYVRAHPPGQPPNVMVAELRPLGEYLRRPMGYNGVREEGRGFRPVTVLSYTLLHLMGRTGGPDGPVDHAWQQHLANLLLHAMSVWIVWGLVRRLTVGRWPPLVAALCFAAQPLHTEVVASIVGRGELLPFVLCGAAALAYLDALGAARRRGWRAGVCAVLLALGLASKESALAWAVFIPLLAVVWARRAVPGRSPWRLQLPLLWAIVAPTALYAALYLRFLGGLHETFGVHSEFNPLFDASLSERLPVAVMVLGYGLGKVFFSSMLACDYGVRVFDTSVGWLSPQVLAASGFLLAMLLGGLWSFSRAPLLFLAVAALLGFSFITSNIPVPIETIFGERLLFTPSLGLSLCAAWLAEEFGARPGATRGLLVLLAGWVLWGVGWCAVRSFEWRSHDALLQADAARQPDSLGIARQVAASLDPRQAQQAGAWLRAMQRCLVIDPHAVSAHNDLALFFLQHGEPERAKQHLDAALEALRLRPREVQHSGDTVYLNLGRWCLVRGDLSGAVSAFGRARALRPDNPLPRIELLWLAHARRDEAAARELLADFARYQPSDPMHALHRGLQSYRRGAFGEAHPLLGGVLLRHRIGGRQVIAAWWALQDCCRQLGRRADELQVLAAMERLMPPAERERVRARLAELR
ncbi:MAG: hypothetical protein H6836_08890 [Planctomycetes bacterium]|nr:hypothetical protein [Planctomycetota bacterium]MCB9889681.1 hypothetical protein [Planctomycetota bacterium]